MRAKGVARPGLRGQRCAGRVAPRGVGEVVNVEEDADALHAFEERALDCPRLVLQPQQKQGAAGERHASGRLGGREGGRARLP